MTAALAALCAGAAAALLVRPRPRCPDHGVPVPPGAAPPSAARRSARRALLSVLAGVGAGVVLGGPAAPVLMVAGAAAAWWALGRAEPAAARRRHEAATRGLPALVQLLGAALRSGVAVGDGVRLACAALPGPSADRLIGVADRLALGADPVRVWQQLDDDPALAPLGRALARAVETGAPVVPTVDRLADELERAARGAVEDRARAVGVRAALPLGLCLLPSFLLLGIVPLVASMVSGITR